MKTKDWNDLVVQLAKMDGPTVTRWYFQVGKTHSKLTGYQKWLVADHILNMALIEAELKEHASTEN